MSPLHLADDAIDPIALAAARWFARHRSGEMTEAQALELQAWLDADTAHRLAYDVVARAWASAGLMRTAPEVLTLRAQHRRSFPRLRRFAGSRAMAACLAAGVIGLMGLGAVETGVIDLRRLPTETYQTQVGEQRTIKLPDGSTVTLNTGTVLRTRGSRHQRLLYLDRGQAFFQVAKDPSRPFIVHANGRTVTAIGTAFDVRVDAGRFEVVLVEGKVKVETPVVPAGARMPLKVQASELVAGNEFVADSDHGWRVEKSDVATQTAWVTGWLRFDRRPLGEIVEELGRYSNRRIVLADPSLASVPVSGRFKPDDTDTFVRALETYRIARVEVSGPSEIRLTAMDEKNNATDYGGVGPNPLLK
jgi:transmembrane sensor